MALKLCKAMLVVVKAVREALPSPAPSEKLAKLDNIEKNVKNFKDCLEGRKNRADRNYIRFFYHSLEVLHENTVDMHLFC